MVREGLSVRLVGMLVAVAGVMGAGAPELLAAPVYFLVTERPGQVEKNDSFVLPLSDPDDIAHARDLVRRGPAAAGRSLISADIVAGADGINRDILAPGKPAWSWHINHFDQFGDVSIELTDGWPGYIEEDVQRWIDNTGGGTVDLDGDGKPDQKATVGHIAFWNYTITAELTGPANDLRILPAGATIPLPAALPAGAALLAMLGCAKLAKQRRA